MGNRTPDNWTDWIICNLGVLRDRLGISRLDIGHALEPESEAMIFNVGDVVIGQNADFNFKRNGMEATIVEPLQIATYQTPYGVFTNPCYRVEWVDGTITWARPHQLRKKNPPSAIFEAGEWELCPWRPERVTRE